MSAALITIAVLGGAAGYTALILILTDRVRRRSAVLKALDGARLKARAAGDGHPLGCLVGSYRQSVSEHRKLQLALSNVQDATRYNATLLSDRRSV